MHILNGDTAAESFKLAFPDTNIDELLIFRDVLSCGPLQAFDDFDNWMTRREAFWHSVLVEEPNPRRFADWQRDFYADWQALVRADELVVWVGCALSDQLLLSFVVYHLARLQLDPGKLKVVQIECLVGRKQTVRGLGELCAEKIHAHPPATGLDDAQIRFCLDTWQAVSSADPEPIISLIERADPPMPVMHHAIRLLISRYPAIEKGLSLWDEEILSCVRDYGPACTRVIGHVLATESSNEFPMTLDTVGDSYLVYRLRNLGSPERNVPLLDVAPLDASLRETKVRLTRAGEDVLDGRQDAISLNGIEDWVGGVHLDSSSNRVWYRSGDRVVPLD
jgi:hypothetical protein